MGIEFVSDFDDNNSGVKNGDRKMEIKDILSQLQENELSELHRFYDQTFRFEYGQLLKELRTDQGITQQQMANETGFSQSSLSQIEKRWTIADETLEPCLKFLGYSLADFINIGTLLDATRFESVRELKKSSLAEIRKRMNKSFKETNEAETKRYISEIVEIAQSLDWNSLQMLATQAEMVLAYQEKKRADRTARKAERLKRTKLPTVSDGQNEHENKESETAKETDCTNE